MSDSLDPSRTGPPARVDLLGAPRLTMGERSSPLRLGRKPLALLAYLSLHGGEEVSREKLAGLLWPDRFEEQARGSLRQALTSLRRALGEHGAAIRTAADGAVSLDPDLLGSDAALLDRLLAADGPGQAEAAAALYRGDFLGRLGDVSEAFDAWAAQERERLRAIAVHTLGNLSETRLAQDRLDEALAHAERLVAVDPAHEPGHRVLMTVLARLGQRAAALRQFETCKAALAQLLDAEPDAETVALAESLRGAPAGTEGAPEDHPPAKAPTPFVRPARAPAPLAGAQRAASQLRRFAWLRPVRRRRLLLGAAFATLAAAIVWAPRLAPSRSESPPGAGPASDERASCLARAGAESEEPALLVLPLRNFGDDPEEDLFAAAATERVQSVLSLIPGVGVIAGPPPGHPDLELGDREIARRNGASHVLAGSVRARKGQVQVSARLVDAGSGRQIWERTARFAAPLEDPVAAQDAIALAAAQGVLERLTDGRQALANPPYVPASLPAWEANTRGWGYLAALDPVAVARARSEFESSLDLDPHGVAARAGLALSYLTPVVFRWTTDAEASLAAAREHAEAARAIAPEYPPASSILSLLALLDGDHPQAVELGERALRYSGGGADAAAYLAFVLSYTDDTARSVELARRAALARPYASPAWYALILGRAARLDGDLETAVTCLSSVATALPTAAAPALELIQAYDARGEPERARGLVRAVLEQAPEGFSSAAWCAVPPYQSAARTAACVAALRRAGLP